MNRSSDHPIHLGLNVLSVLRSGIAALVLLCTFPLLAQVDNVMVYGTVKDMTTAKKLDGVIITVFKNGAKLVEVSTNASGKYEVNLDYGADYKIMCAKPAFVGKNITIDTRNVPEEERSGGHGMNIDFTMMAELSDVDYSILLEPFGKAKYDKATGNFEWDIDYTTRMRDAQAKLLKEYADRKKREANAEGEYVKAMEAGTAAMTAADHKKAVESFTTALVIKPNDPVATAKLSDARMRLEQQDADKKVDEQFAALIKEADALFAKKELEPARTKYQAAIALKEQEAHPKQRIKEIDVMLADLAKKAEEERKAKELQEKYQATIVAADAAFKAENWDQATAKYTEAGGLKPEEKYPKDQLAVVATKKADAAKKAEEVRLAKELNEKYQAAITAGDAAFKASNWDIASTKYTEAGGLKPEEKYPKDQLAAIALKRDEQARKAEEERLAKELQQKYQAAVAAGDAAFQGARYDDAVAKYNEASALKPEEKYPKDQLLAIQKKKDEQAQKAEEERLAKELNERYQASIAAADQAFQASRWDDATARYTEAAGLKPAEKYPKDQLAAIVKKKDEEAKAAEAERKQRELDERYQGLIAEADAAFAREDWTAAKTRYSEAGGVKPTETYPKERIAEVDRRIAASAELKRQQELDARYQEIIAAADAAFNSQDLQAAKAKYVEASGVKSQERYPKDRIAEVDALIAEQARKAEEARLLKERDERYAALIVNADKAFDGGKLSAALNDYKDALLLKPEEAHPKARIAAIEDQLDSAAKAKAEEERLLREQQDRDKRYGDLILTADKAFTAKQYEKARSDYEGALAVKPEESHPKDRLEEIERILKELADKAAADQDAAAREAAERARKAEADRLAAELAAAEKARLEEEERQRQQSKAEIDARYREHVAAADIAFGQDQFDKAREQYTAALGVKPQESYPKDRLAAIDAELARRAQAMSEAERLAEERRRAEEEQRLKAERDAEAARLAAASNREREEAERLRREAEEAEARRLADERERLEREGSKALEERYRSAIIEADEAMAAKDWLRARGRYAEASDLKPSETYPLAKIDQIDKLMAEEERLRAEAELAAQRAREAQQQEQPRSGSTIDIRKEEEAEAFLRALREREEAEKYERIKKFRSDLEAQEEANAGSAADRRMQGVSEKERLQLDAAGLYQGSESDRLRNAEDMEAYKAELAETEAQRMARAAEERDRNYQDAERVQERLDERSRSMTERNAQEAEDVNSFTAAVRNAEQQRSTAGLNRQVAARDDVLAQADQHAAMQSRRQEILVEKQRSVEAEKRAEQARGSARIQAAAQQRDRTKAALDATPLVQPRAFAEHTRSKLAQEYPEGVTEESYTEGNKVIIRRVVVNGNRADEYSKVIAKWGTFYFKNGQSITEPIWKKETEG